jgi:sec-independent protein translocase protein TatA
MHLCTPATHKELAVPGIGPMEIVVVLIIALVVLGPKRLPEAGRSVGRGLREFKSSLSSDPAPPAEELAEREPVR